MREMDSHRKGRSVIPSVFQSIAFTGGWESRLALHRGVRDAAGAEHAAGMQTAGEGPVRVLPVWRGRPLVVGAGSVADQPEGPGQAARLGWVAPDSPVLRHARPERLLLGQHDGAVRLAADISSWEPAGLDRAAMAMFVDPGEYRHPDLPGDHRFIDMRRLLLDLPPAEAALAGTARALFNWHRSHRFCSACGHASDWAQSGWERQCPSCGAKHFPRTDPVVIMLVTRGDRVLLGRSPAWPEGMYSALAGFVEPGETLEAAVAREVFEETAIRIGRVSYVASQPWPWPSSLMLGFHAEAVTEAITRDDELEDALWITRSEAVAVMAGTHPRIRKPRGGAIAHGLLAAWLEGRLD